MVNGSVARSRNHMLSNSLRNGGTDQNSLKGFTDIQWTEMRKRHLRGETITWVPDPKYSTFPWPVHSGWLYYKKPASSSETRVPDPQEEATGSRQERIQTHVSWKPWCSLLHGDLPPQALPHPRPPGPGLPVDSGSPRWQPPSPWGLCWDLASGRIPSGASATWGSLKELRSSSGIPLPGPRGRWQHVAGLRLGWAWQPGIQEERKEFVVEGTDLEWQGLKRQVRRSRYTPTADVKICHALLCWNTRVLRERHVPGSVGCPDLFRAVLTSCNHLSRTAEKAPTTDEAHLPFLFPYHRAIWPNVLHKGAGIAATKRYSESASLFLIRLSICLANKSNEVS